MILILRAGSGQGKHFLLLFSESVSFPPNIHDMKAYYITKEMLLRGMRVTWLTLGNSFKVERKEGITFCTIPRIFRRFKNFSFWFRITIVVAICKVTRVSSVCVDDWLFFRWDTSKFLAYEIAFKSAGVKFVSDHRDPFLDFEISRGNIHPNTPLHKTLANRYHAIYARSDLVVVPSHRYKSIVVEEEGLPPSKVIGAIRGIDPDLFNPAVEPLSLFAEKELRDKFTIGWFGIMHPHRQIREILVPLIRTIGDQIHNSRVVIGGDGPEKEAFTGLQQEYSDRFSMFGFIPYSILPRYIAACNVLLCPVDTRFRFSRTSIWLKILESLAVGRPIIATRTDVSDDDLSTLKGVIWVDGSFDSYQSALLNVFSEYKYYKAQAMEQAKNFEEYTTPRTIARIVDSIISATTRK